MHKLICTFMIILWWITRDYYYLVGLRCLALTNSLLSCARWLWDLKATLTVSRCLLWRHWENLVRTLTDWLHVTVIHNLWYALNLLFRFGWKRSDVGDPSTTDRPQCIFPSTVMITGYFCIPRSYIHSKIFKQNIQFLCMSIIYCCIGSNPQCCL